MNPILTEVLNAAYELMDAVDAAARSDMDEQGVYSIFSDESDRFRAARNAADAAGYSGVVAAMQEGVDNGYDQWLASLEAEVEAAKNEEEEEDDEEEEDEDDEEEEDDEEAMEARIRELEKFETQIYKFAEKVCSEIRRGAQYGDTTLWESFNYGSLPSFGPLLDTIDALPLPVDKRLHIKRVAEEKGWDNFAEDPVATWLIAVQKAVEDIFWVSTEDDK